MAAQNQQTQTFTDIVVNWAKQPFRPDGDLIDWILFWGIAVLASFIWSQILKDVQEAL